MAEPVSELEQELGYPTTRDAWGLPVEGPPMLKDQAWPALLLDESLGRHAQRQGLLWRVAFNSRVDFRGVDGQLRWVFPDVYVVTGVPEPSAPGPYRVFVHERAPDAVFELAVESSVGMDRREKIARYRDMGAREYYVFDVAAREVPGLVEGWALTPDGDYRPLEPVPSPLGARRLRSARLGLELEPVTDDRCPDGFALRAFAPGGSEPLPTPDEAALRGATRRADEATRRADEATRRADAATRRVDALEAELRRLRDGE